MKRRPFEDFQAFRERRLEENKMIREKLKGKLIWVSIKLSPPDATGMRHPMKPGNTYFRTPKVYRMAH